jgi:hypothetical protein
VSTSAGGEAAIGKREAGHDLTPDGVVHAAAGVDATIREVQEAVWLRQSHPRPSHSRRRGARFGYPSSMMISS